MIRRIRLFWHKLWIRKNEFHPSLDMDIEAMMNMNKDQFQKYLKNLTRRRQIAHDRDLSEISNAIKSSRFYNWNNK